MAKRFCYAAWATALYAALVVVPARAQVAPSAFGPADTLWVGAEYSNISAAFPYQIGQRLQGVGAFADFHMKGRLGLEGNARFLRFGGFEGSTETNYLAGPKIFFLARNRFWPYGKLLAGEAKIHYPFAIGDARYFALAPGVGAEYWIRRRWMLRVDYEYQMWHGSPGYANEPNHELRPNGFHVGIAYRFFR